MCAADPVLQVLCAADPVLQVLCAADTVLQVLCAADPVLQVLCAADPVLQVLCAADPVLQVLCAADPVLQVLCAADTVLQVSSFSFQFYQSITSPHNQLVHSIVLIRDFNKYEMDIFKLSLFRFEARGTVLTRSTMRWTTSVCSTCGISTTWRGQQIAGQLVVPTSLPSAPRSIPPVTVRVLFYFLVIFSFTS